MTTTTVSAKLKKVFDTHLPIEDASSRAVQRVAALYIGHTNGGKIEAAALRSLCDALHLFEYQGRTGENNFGANFTQNMKKDIAIFALDSGGWKLTAAGKAEAVRVFDNGEAPTRRRMSGAPKAPKAAKATKAKAPKAPKAAKPAKAPKAPTPKAGKAGKKAAAVKSVTPPPSDEAARKAAAKRRALTKKRDLSETPAPAATSAAPEPATAPTAG